MKKRKPPIVLISIIVLMLIGVAIMNSPKSSNDSGNTMVDAGRESASAEDISKAQKNIVSKADLPKGGNHSIHSPMPEREGGRPGSGAPAIKVAKPSDVAKQAPNDNSQMGQWYTDESAVKNPKGITVTMPPK